MNESLTGTLSTKCSLKVSDMNELSWYLAQGVQATHAYQYHWVVRTLAVL